MKTISEKAEYFRSFFELEGDDKYKKIASHKDWVSGATITESRKENGDTRFVATIEGWRNFTIYEGKPSDEISKEVQKKVREIRDRLKSGDESILNENTSINQKPSATEALKEELGKKKSESKEREITVFGKQQKVKTKPIELNLGYGHPFEIARGGKKCS